MQNTRFSIYAQDIEDLLGGGFCFSTSKRFPTNTLVAEQCDWEDFAEHITRHVESPAKVGSFYSPALYNNDRFGTAHALRIDAVVFDLDKGQSLNEIRRCAAGLEAVIVSTHSHGSTSTRFRLTQFNQFNGDAEALMRAKGYHAGVAEGACVARDEEGKLVIRKTVSRTGKPVQEITIEHRPCEKYRLALFPKRPWIRKCDEDVTRYCLGMRQLAVRLGLKIDRACTNVARLYFDPRHQPGTTPVVVETKGERVEPPWETAEIPERLKRPSGVSNDPSGVSNDPRQKGGTIGAFCRVYSIEAAIAEFDLPYTPSARAHNRYTYDGQTSADGAEALDNGLILCVYSDSDPVKRHCESPKSGFGFANAFDLVRIHLFGELDSEEDLQRPVQERPSFRKMLSHACSDEHVRWEMYGQAFDYDDVEGMDLGERQVGEPIDFLTETSAAPLPRGALPSVIEDYAFDQAELMGVDPAGIALGCLVACAAAIDDKFKVQPKRFDDGWTESARLWGVVVGDPSTKKTPALGAAIKCVEALERELWEQDRKKLEAYEVKVKAHEKQMKAFQEKIGKREISFDDDEWETAPPPPVKPKMRRTIVKDITVEKLADILTDNERGILAFHDELSGFFGAMDAYKSPGVNKDRASWPHGLQRRTALCGPRRAREHIHPELVRLRPRRNPARVDEEDSRQDR